LLTLPRAPAPPLKHNVIEHESTRTARRPQTSPAARCVDERSVEDRQRLEQLPEVRGTLDNLPGTANLIIKLYHEVGSYGA
jgi:hypothetical protein